MRALHLLAASTLLAGVVVVVPVVNVGAEPHSVSPAVESVPMPVGTPFADTPQGHDAPAPTTQASPRADRSAAPEAEGSQSVIGRQTDGADVVGVTFPDEQTAEAVEVSVRTRVGRTWGEWIEAAPSDGAPDPASAESQGSRTTSEPVGVTGSDEVQVRVRSTEGARLDRVAATFVDAGTSAADTRLGAQPAASAGAAVAKPNVITRAQWGADESLRRCTPDSVRQIKGAVVHHTVNANTYTAEQAASLVRGIYAYHTRTNGWCDIGYNYLVDRFGRTYEGRADDANRNLVGAHAAGFNSQTVGVASIGTHQASLAGSITPSSEVLAAIGRVIGWKASLNGWDPASSVSFTSAGNSKYAAGTNVTKPRVSGHRDFNDTSCPGDLAYSAIASIRSTASSLYWAKTPTAPTSTPAPTTPAPTTPAPTTPAPTTPSATVPSALSPDEVYARPSSGSYSLSGRGYGHGYGMSQYGAYGAALRGLSSTQILAFYYPGTSLESSMGNSAIRVRLTAAGSGGTRVKYQTGLTVQLGSKVGSLYAKNADGSLRQDWRIVRSGSGLVLQWLEKGSWRSTSSWRGATLSFVNAKAGKIRVVMPDGTQRDYRRTISTHVFGSAAMTVNSLPLNYYLQSVVPSEMPSSWSAAALESQAIAARTFAVYSKRAQPTGSLFDTCDSTACQVFKGLAGYSSSGALTPFENAATTAAVTRTSTRGLMYGGVPALTQFSSSNGGYTRASSLRYQVSKADPYDAVPSGSPGRWSASLAVSKIQSAYPSTGSLRAVHVKDRDGVSTWGGRTTTVTIQGSKGSVTVTGDAFRTAVGLRSTWWAVT